MKVLFVGGGNMCQAIIGGLCATGHAAAEIHAIEPLAETRAALQALGIAASAEFNPSLLDAEVIVLAVKPQMMRQAIAPFAGQLKTQLIVSIAAGIRCVDMAAWLAGTGAAPYANIVRAMPNTPALIRAGITGLYATAGVTPPMKMRAETLLSAVGATAWFDDESMLDAVTAVSGSGPAYVFYFIEALEDAARKLGFADDVARQFALQTFLGGAKLAAGSDESPSVLRQRVTSKKGTTEAAIACFDALDLKAHFGEGVQAACARSRELGEALGREATAATGNA